MCGGTVFLALLFTAAYSSAQDEEIVLTIPESTSRPAVVFPHELHTESYDCLECHHNYDETGENVLDESDLEDGNPDILCGACHTPKSKVHQREAFHRQCMGCHEKFIFNKRPTGPVLCGECHVKKED